MPTAAELEQRARRRAWWLRVARESRGLSQAGVAEALGLSRKSASTIGDWERMVSEPSLRQLDALASLYDAPLDLFMSPPETDEERFVTLAARAIRDEAEDWGRGAGPGAEGGSGGGPGRRVA